MHINVTDAVVKGILVGLFMAISVGPTIFAVIRYSLTFSYRAGLAFVLGVSVSDIMFVTLANLAANWLEYLKPYEKHIAFGGSVLLMGMGLIGLLRRKKIKRPTGPATVSNADYLKIWVSGFLINTLNPGALLTWLGAVTLTAESPANYRFVLFGTCLVVILSVDFSKVFLAAKIKKLLTLRRMHYLQIFSSACLFLIGLSLFLTTAFGSQLKDKEGNSRIDKILQK